MKKLSGSSMILLSCFSVLIFTAFGADRTGEGSETAKKTTTAPTPSVQIQIIPNTDSGGNHQPKNHNGRMTTPGRGYTGEGLRTLRRAKPDGPSPRREETGRREPIPSAGSPVPDAKPVVKRDVVKYPGNPEDLMDLLSANEFPYELQNGNEFILGASALSYLRREGVALQKVGLNISPAPDDDGRPDSDRSQRSAWVGENGTDINIPDFDGIPGVATSWINCSESGAIWAVTYSVLVNHPWPGDLDISIVHNGVDKQIWFHDYFLGDDGGLDDDLETDDDIDLIARSTTEFNGLDINGDWGLRCSDNYSAFLGTIDWWSITLYYGCAAEAPYPAGDPCYQSVTDTDSYCCDTAWDSICEDEYWACYTATCVEAPYPTDDSCYIITVAADSFCCDGEWDSLCQCEYIYCAEVTDQDPPVILSAALSGQVDDDGDGWLESWTFDIEVIPGCGGQSNNIWVDINTTDVFLGYSLSIGEYEVGPGGPDTLVVDAYYYFSSEAYDLDMPQVVSMTLVAHNDYGSSAWDITVPIDVGCPAGLPTVPLTEKYCSLETLNLDPFCCATEWDGLCESEMLDCWMSALSCIEMPYPSTDTCFQQAMGDNPLACCWEWTDSCQSAYDTCFSGMCNNIPGDANQDGFVDVSDIVLLVGFILETVAAPTPCELFVSDLFADGVLNVMDVVALVDLILNPALTNREPVEEAQFRLQNGELIAEADGQIAGLQLETEGRFEITGNMLPTGWELQRSEKTILIFSMDGSPLEDGRLFTYEGQLFVVENVVADWQGHGITASVQVENDQYALLGAWPNPFNPVTTIRYAIPVRGHVEISIYDMLGKRIVQLVDEEIQAGIHEIKWDGTGQSSGIYFVEMVTSGKTDTQRIVLLK